MANIMPSGSWWKCFLLYFSALPAGYDAAGKQGNTEWFREGEDQDGSASSLPEYFSRWAPSGKTAQSPEIWKQSLGDRLCQHKGSLPLRTGRTGLLFVCLPDCQIKNPHCLWGFKIKKGYISWWHRKNMKQNHVYSRFCFSSFPQHNNSVKDAFWYTNHISFRLTWSCMSMRVLSVASHLLKHRSPLTATSTISWGKWQCKMILMTLE